jgi:AcrR family transcriptional regulator
MATARPTATRPRKRGQLDREVILDAATRLSAGGEQITFRALGAALGSDPTAVYRHFRDKDELVRAVFDRLQVRVVESIDRAGSWREQLVEAAVLTWRISEEHPSVGIEARAMITGGPGELGAVELLLEMFQQAGLDRSEAVRFYAVFASYVLSVASSVAAPRLNGNRHASMEGTWIGDVGPVDPSRYPAVAAARAELAALRDPEVFMLGVEVILDAAEAAANRA